MTQKLNQNMPIADKHFQENNRIQNYYAKDQLPSYKQITNELGKKLV